MAKAVLKQCPICGKPAVERYWPFCSSRCADIDLGRWFTGKYAIKTEEKPLEAETGEENWPDGQKKH